MEPKCGSSVGGMSNYFRHTLFDLHKPLDVEIPKLIRSLSAKERCSMEGLVIGFPSCVFLVDGNKNKRRRPKHSNEQELAYDGYKKSHCYSILLFYDIFGRFIRVEITDHGAESDHSLYTRSDFYRNRERYLFNAQHGMADMGFAGDGELVVPYKRTESTSWLYKNEHNKEIRQQHTVNEW
ncbi:hypothetical protein BWQ96_05633 [Gracilariopsis chorda]|uniref:DDE Tnp4 domain-containing protein n=1 Tax=Gracilariopsis chorda TaxID=448386 RepID=A0A2V3IR97_9FLOR|nr:hypothetical protein BWQ96_05633 [Gracilariopsis chorda]|eukprot:PXF44638.1 hypothetical protein BWQ96_05633 [Gracilariopsis chorda]